jgi:hypothetical protein
MKLGLFDGFQLAFPRNGYDGASPKATKDAGSVRVVQA